MNTHGEILLRFICGIEGQKPLKVHRDVPDDVSEDEAVSSSFSMTSKSGSRSRRIVGIRGYIAPALIVGRAVSGRSDVFALGVVLLQPISCDEPDQKKIDRARKEYGIELFAH
ncbi:G-type lectin S-receptor-like serine/threonine-protein kinase [Platanthera zijinensis]|uniref:G-type lectin S-receptor-like serine/threonine-protein kinase n=1 Tax=Platanthera zijinensis TaxID=2320716 RepID=A0AAP0AZL5_9ASPA